MAGEPRVTSPAMPKPTTRLTQAGAAESSPTWTVRPARFVSTPSPCSGTQPAFAHRSSQSSTGPASSVQSTSLRAGGCGIRERYSLPRPPHRPSSVTLGSFLTGRGLEDAATRLGDGQAPSERSSAAASVYPGRGASPDERRATQGRAVPTERASQISTWCRVDAPGQGTHPWATRQRKHHVCRRSRPRRHTLSASQRHAHGPRAAACAGRQRQADRIAAPPSRGWMNQPGPNRRFSRQREW